jgi:hypothetical protein
VSLGRRAFWTTQKGNRNASLPPFPVSGDLELQCTPRLTFLAGWCVVCCVRGLGLMAANVLFKRGLWTPILISPSKRMSLQHNDGHDCNQTRLARRLRSP